MAQEHVAGRVRVLDGGSLSPRPRTLHPLGATKIDVILEKNDAGQWHVVNPSARLLELAGIDDPTLLTAADIREVAAQFGVPKGQLERVDNALEYGEWLDDWHPPTWFRRADGERQWVIQHWQLLDERYVRVMLWPVPAPDTDEELVNRVERIEEWIERHHRVQPSGPRHSGPLYYSDPVEFSSALETAVGTCVQDLEPPTMRNVLRHIEKAGGLKISPNTLASRLKEHQLLKPGQTPAIYLKTLASRIRKQRGHMLLAIALVLLVVVVLADQTVFADNVTATTTRALGHVAELCAHRGAP